MLAEVATSVIIAGKTRKTVSTIIAMSPCPDREVILRRFCRPRYSGTMPRLRERPRNT